MGRQKNRVLAAKSLGALLTLAVVGFGAGLYWYSAGRLELRGAVQPVWLEACAATQGRIGNIAVRAGQRVKSGQVLVSLGEEARRNSLVEAQAQLTALARMLPPRYRPASGPESGLEQGPGRDGESLEQRHDRLQAEEETARLRLQEASDHEAAASVYYSRIAMMFARHEVAESDRAVAETRLAAAGAEKVRIKADFEAASRERAASGNELLRVKETQMASGAGNLPLDTRLALYRQQRDRVASARLALEQTIVRSPVDGVVVEVRAVVGKTAMPGAPLVLLDPDEATLVVAARASKEDRQRIKTGMRCMVRIEGEETDHEGRITALRPLNMTADGNGDDTFRVDAAILAGSAAGTPVAPKMADAAGLGALVTVFLREPLTGTDDAGQYRADAPQALPDATGAAPARPGAEVPPQAPALPEVKTPVAKANVEPSFPASEALRPMRAPYPLRGSSASNSANNPSVVGEDILGKP